MMATIMPPPASASWGSARVNQVHQPTGAAVAISPQRPKRTAVTGSELPNAMSATAMTAITAGMMTSVRYRPFLEEPSNQSRADEASHPESEEQERKRGGIDVGRRLQERSQIGEQGELAHEEQARCRHA